MNNHVLMKRGGLIMFLRAVKKSFKKALDLSLSWAIFRKLEKEIVKFRL